MFEKEAEEWADSKKSFWRQGRTCIDSVRQAFQKGAEFGYNKAKEDADKMKSRFLELCNLKDMRIEELEKANEWHYVKDGDLPPKTTLVLIKACGCFILGWLDDNDVWHNDSDNGARIPKDNIYAWKEIVLPKESE